MDKWVSLWMSAHLFISPEADWGHGWWTALSVSETRHTKRRSNRPVLACSIGCLIEKRPSKHPIRNRVSSEFYGVAPIRHRLLRSRSCLLIENTMWHMHIHWATCLSKRRLNRSWIIILHENEPLSRSVLNNVVIHLLRVKSGTAHEAV